jgi:hypothetical protein
MSAPQTEPESDLLDTFRAVFEEGNRAWNERDFERAYGALPDDVDYHLAPTWPQARPLHGRNEVVAFFRDFCETFPDARTASHEFMQADRRTMIVGLEVLGTGASSGIGTTMQIWQVWEVDPGLVPKRVREYLDRGSALKAAGITEGE